MNAKQIAFAQEYIIDHNATQAYVRAYGTEDESARRLGSLLLTNVDVANYVSELERQAATKKLITAEWVLEKYRELAEADPNELTNVRIIPCRYCWGIDHKFQWREREYEEALQKALDNPKGKTLPVADGGFGYDMRREPYPDCPECLGEGIERVSVRASAGKRLFSGVKVKKDGSIEVMTRNQDQALQVLAKYAGIAIDRKELSGSVEVNKTVRAEDLSDDELAAIIAANSNGGEE